MQITLDAQSLAALSSSARMEIAQLIMRVDPGSEARTAYRLYELHPELLRSFMQKLSDKTKAVLQFFAENDGSATLQELLQVTGGESINDVKGVFSGLTRRIRNIDPAGGAESYVVDWDEENNTYSVSAATLRTLKVHFVID